MVWEGQTTNAYQEPFLMNKATRDCTVRTCKAFHVQSYALKLNYSLPHLEDHQVDPHPKLYTADELLSLAFKC